MARREAGAIIAEPRSGEWIGFIGFNEQIEGLLGILSQRPSELSRTVLSQCSNFVVHRIQNPDDLAHIHQMTPFISESVLKRLPLLQKQHALIFGNAVNIPTTFMVRNVNPAPDSSDTEIREIWFRPDGFEVQL